MDVKEDSKLSTMCLKTIKRNLLVILTIVGVVVGLIVGFSVREANPSADAIMWIGRKYH